MKVVVAAFKKEMALVAAFSMIVKLKTSRMFISSSSSHRPADNRPWFGNEVGQFPHSTNKTFMVPHPGAGHLANGYCFLITSFGLGNQKTSFICFQCAFSVLVHCCKVATFVCLFLLLLQCLWLKETARDRYLLFHFVTICMISR